MKTTSILNLIDKIIRDVGRGKLTTDQIAQIPEWLFEVVQDLGSINSLEHATKKIYVKDYKSKLPCGFQQMISVYNDKGRLRMTGNNTLSKYDDIKESYTHDTYLINLNYIHTTIEEGELTIDYLEIPSDEEGYPLIPDDSMYKECLYYYVIMKLISQGFQHAVFKFKDAYDLYRNHLVLARNSINKWTPEHAERDLNSTRTFIFPRHYYKTYFQGAETPTKISHL